jgi:hypothetical protein
MNNSVAIIKKIERRDSALIYLETEWELYRLLFNGDEWRLSEASWQSHRFGRPVVNRHPRWKLVARLSSLPTLHEGGRVPLMDDKGNFPKLGKA